MVSRLPSMDEGKTLGEAQTCNDWGEVVDRQLI